MVATQIPHEQVNNDKPIYSGLPNTLTKKLGFNFERRNVMKYVFISQPMKGLSDNQININRNELIEYAKSKYGVDAEIIDSFFEGAPANKKPIWFLGKSIEKLSDAEVVIMGPGWEDTRGCKIEHDVAKAYGMDIDYYNGGIDSEVQFR